MSAAKNVLRMQPRQQATMTHSLHCDLSPQMQQAHRTTHTWTTTRCRTPRRTNSTMKYDRSRNSRTHKVPFIAGCSHFTRKNTRFRALASSPKQTHATVMQHYNQRFPKSPRSPRHRFPRSPHSLRHHFPRSPLPTVTTYLRHHFHHPSSCTVVWCKVSQGLFVRNSEDCFPTSFAYVMHFVAWCIVMWCIVAWCIVVWCIVVWCNCCVMYCYCYSSHS